jgi:hypothetical protein
MHNSHSYPATTVHKLQPLPPPCAPHFETPVLHFNYLSKLKNAQRINIFQKIYFFEHQLQAKTLFILKIHLKNIFFVIGIAVALRLID